MLPKLLAMMVAVTTPVTPHPRYACERVKGLDQVKLPNGNGPHFIIVGELHGTVQQPRFFGNLVCQLSQDHPLNIMLEFASHATPAMQTYVASDGSADAKRLFLSDSIWDPKYADGRNSAAMFDLIEYLRQLKTAGANIEVYARQTDHLDTTDQFYSELARADDWARIAAANPERLNVIFVGAAHAALDDNHHYGFLPATAHLRPADVFAIGPTDEGGKQWSLSVSPTGQPLIGVHLMKGRPAQSVGISIAQTASSGWNATYAFGQTARASLPARR